MGLEEKVMSDMKDAMKAKDEAGLRGLRAIKAAIIIAKTAEGAGGELKTEDEAKLLQKLVKQRKDSLEIYEKQNREDLAKKEREEIAIIEKFLPKQLDEASLKEVLRKIIADTGANSAADMGKVMGIATKQLAGQADGKTIGAAVKELLAK
jgi:uncharacterized protein YqeY